MSDCKHCGERLLPKGFDEHCHPACVDHYITKLEQKYERLREAVLAIHDYDMKRARPTGWECDWTLFALIDNAVRAALDGETGDER